MKEVGVVILHTTDGNAKAHQGLSISLHQYQ